MRLTDQDDRRRLRRVIFGTLVPIILTITIFGLFRAMTHEDHCAFDAREPSYACSTAAFNGVKR